MRAESESTVPETEEASGRSSTQLTTVAGAARADDGVVQLRILPRADAGFVTHLIAVQQASPQTRTLRRATSADALAAYHTTAVRSERPAELTRVTRRNV
ncbi:MAG TPA: hypothetical protein VGC77_03995 [Rhodopseudomonas sp.]|uniref:hypothetical protein n=1 Tax=Rhodopseudomonas sp. TaxID=1078 RepID=UPI002EDB2B14